MLSVYVVLSFFIIFSTSSGEDEMISVLLMGFGLVLLIFFFTLTFLKKLFSKTTPEKQIREATQKKRDRSIFLLHTVKQARTYDNYFFLSL